MIETMRGAKERLLDTIIEFAVKMNVETRDRIIPDMEYLIKVAREEGREQMKSELLSSPLTSWCGRSDEYGDMVMMPKTKLMPEGGAR